MKLSFRAFLTKEVLIPLVFLLCTVALSTIIYLVGPVPQLSFCHDLFPVLEGGAKTYEGLRPYVDYHTLIGPVPNLIIALGMLIEGPVPRALSTSVAMTTPLLGLAVWFFFLKDNRTIISLGIAMFVCLVWSTPCPLHQDYSKTGYAMSYNREGFALLILATLFVISNSKCNPVWLGVIIGISAFVKIPFGLAAMPLILLYYYKEPSLRKVGWVVAGLSISSLGMVIYLGIDGVRQMLAFSSEAGRMQTMELLSDRFSIVYLDFFPAIALIPMGWLVWRSSACTFPQLLLEYTCVGGSALFADFCGSPLGSNADLPPLVVYSLFLVGKLFGQPGRRKGKVLGAICCGLAGGAMYLRSIYCITFVVSYHIKPIQYEGASIIHGKGFENVRFIGRCGFYEPLTFADKVNDGLSLIAKHPDLTDTRIASLDFSDFFSLPRHIPAPLHMPMGIHYKFTMDETHYPDPDFFFEGCSGVMIPKSPDTPIEGSFILRKVYAAYINSHFPHVDESNSYVLHYK